MIKANWKNSFGGLSVVFVLAAVTPLIFAPPARAADYDIGSIHITQPWARATPKGASSGAAYMAITNNGKTPDRVSCVSSDASAQCQIHTMATEDGVMKMRPVEGGLEIKPGHRRPPGNSRCMGKPLYFTTYVHIPIYPGTGTPSETG